MRIKLYRKKWYAVETVGGSTRRRSLRTADRDTALRRLEDLTAPPPAALVGEIVERYLTDLDQRASRPDRAHDAWKALERHFAHLAPKQITRDKCRVYHKHRLGMGRAPGTVNKELSTLRAALRWNDPRHPAIIEMLPGTPPKDRSLSRDEYKRLLAAAKPPHLRLFIILALATAGRSQALFGLTWDRVDFTRNRIHLGEGRGKGRATVPITGPARAALEAAEEVATCEYVVEYAGRRVGSVKRAFKAACVLAEITVSPHVLRHTAAVWMAEASVPMSVIAQYLGHADSRITERVYAKYGPEYLSGAAKALE